MADFCTAVLSNTGGYYNINIGRVGTGKATVDGAGSFLGAYGFAPRITVGDQGGNGQLDITGGGAAGALSVVIGRREGNGQVLVYGAGSELNVNSGYGQYGTYNSNDYSGSGASIQIGRQMGGGQLQIFGGGVVNVTNTDGVTDGARVVVGRDGGNGAVNVSGVGSELNIVQYGAVGDDSGFGARLQVGVSGEGEGNAFVSYGGVINVLGDKAQVQVGANHDDSPTGNIPNSLAIGYGGVVNVNSQTGTQAASVRVGTEGNSGFVSVNGSGSQLNIESSTLSNNGFAANVMLGHYGGSGTLYVADGGKVKIDGGGGAFPNLILGSYDGTGLVMVTGSGSAIDIHGTSTQSFGSGGALMVGGTPSTHHGDGLLRIADGGSITLHSPNSIMGIAVEHGGSSGAVEVTGAGSSLNVGGTLAIGGGADMMPDTDGGLGILDFNPARNGGTAGLIVTDGATLSAQDILIGAGANVDLSGNITGNLHNYGFFAIGVESSATLNLTGDFNMENGQAALLFSIEDFNGGTGDMFNVTGDAHINFRTNILALNVDPGTNFGIGARYTMGSVSGHLDFKETVVYDLNSGASFRAFATGAGLVRLESLTGLFNGFAYEDKTDGNNSANTLTGDAMDNYINGKGGADNLSGADGGDVLLGGGGNDTLNGDNGRDLLIGGASNDIMNGGRGNDKLDGGTGVDTMHGDDHDDHLLGGGGGDTLFGDNGNDTLDGEGGADTLHGGNGNDILRGGGGNDILNGDSGNDLLFGEADHDTLNGGGGDDLLFGNVGNDTLNGDGGDDTLNGGDGNDTLDGGSQSDILIGGAGADSLTGGAGGDVFRFFNASEIGTNSGNRDVITDFQSGLDLIDLSGIDANSNTADDDFFTFIGSSSFTGNAGELRRINSGGDKLVQGDVDGDGIADFRLEITGGVSVTESDFIL
ncbi:MAG: hypothetical protein K8F59_00595 [Rhodobacteraceae bacterium]|nr:hypothetical protein [Paracoccaceae bacterium]